MKRQNVRGGFTLIELLMVIGIIGLLMALLLPAIQGARELARRMTCQSNLRQLYLGVKGEIDATGRYPAGGWGWQWTGDPNRGNREDQPGGWMYNILPFLDQQALHDIGLGLGEEERKTVLTDMMATPIGITNCPSRRGPGPYEHMGVSVYNAVRPQRQSVTDYALNGGDFATSARGPLQPGYAAAKDYTWPNDSQRCTGLSYLRSRIRPVQVSDGESHVYMIGEKYLEPQYYEYCGTYGDDHSICQGHDDDIVRWTAFYGDDESLLPPQRDKEGKNLWFSFGSAHPTVWNVIFCDGSVRGMSYDVDPLVHRRLGNRRDGEQVDPNKTAK